MQLDKAYRKLAQAMSLLTNVTVTIMTTKPVKNGPFTNGQPKVLLKDYPAKVSKGNLSAGQQSEYLSDEYDAMLLINCKTKLPAGCTIIATSNDGQVTEYKRASRSYHDYRSHQEVAMVLKDKA